MVEIPRQKGVCTHFQALFPGLCQLHRRKTGSTKTQETSLCWHCRHVGGEELPLGERQEILPSFRDSSLISNRSYLPQQEGEETVLLQGPRQSCMADGGLVNMNPIYIWRRKNRKLSGPGDQLSLEEGLKALFHSKYPADTWKILPLAGRSRNSARSLPLRLTCTVSAWDWGGSGELRIPYCPYPPA